MSDNKNIPGEQLTTHRTELLEIVGEPNLAYVEANPELEFLLPFPTEDSRNPNLKCFIGTTPVTEDDVIRIKSKREAEIIELREDHPFYQIPSSIQILQKQYGSPTFEMTTPNCTVGCDFCFFSEHGPIMERIGIQTYTQILQSLHEVPDLQYNIDIKSFVDAHKLSTLDRDYWASDILDWKGEDPETGEELDALSIIKLRQDLELPAEIRTAIPLGEEITFIRIIEWIMENPYPSDTIPSEDGEGPDLNVVHISLTRDNESRFLLICNYLVRKYPNIKLPVIAYERRTDTGISKNYRQATAEESASYKDLSSIATRDDIIIRPETIARMWGTIPCDKYPHATHMEEFSSGIAPSTKFPLPQYVSPFTGAPSEFFAFRPAYDCWEHEQETTIQLNKDITNYRLLNFLAGMASTSLAGGGIDQNSIEHFIAFETLFHENSETAERSTVEWAQISLRRIKEIAEEDNDHLLVQRIEDLLSIYAGL